MDYNSKRVGNLTEICCMSSFIELGYNVLIPFGDCERYDFIVDYKGTFLKVQCKTARTIDDGKTIEISGRSHMKRNGHNFNRHYTKEEIDYFATYYNNTCYLIPVEDMGSSKKLRLIPPNNFQKERINFAESYEITHILNNL